MRLANWTATQVKLLRFLGERTFGTAGIQQDADRGRPAHHRHQQGSSGAREGGPVPEDLYHRLAVVPIHLPAQKGWTFRRLATAFPHEFAADNGKPVKPDPKTDAMDLLLHYHWLSGNVREPGRRGTRRGAVPR